ncbi:MAG: hypothetical protein BWZ09_02568 [Alphaproteobacteria bacterium ADurb.BinA305]|nr:MAG: hypothetical protein BWZ09_02568 [Alphaproteobacteria bacterium ADurb.BinA305]
MRLAVSWICSRIMSMPPMVFCTTREPVLASATERSATPADSAALEDTWSMVIAISVIADEAPAISWAWCSAASARCSAVAWVSSAACETLREVWLIEDTSTRNWSMV